MEKGLHFFHLPAGWTEAVGERGNIVVPVKWDIKSCTSIFHRVSDQRLKLWIKTGKVRAGEFVVRHSNLSDWRKPEELEELIPCFKLYENAQPGTGENPEPARSARHETKRINSILLIDDER